MTASHRLAAILTVDVTGYSRLMSADEEGTQERLKAHPVTLPVRIEERPSRGS